MYPISVSNFHEPEGGVYCISTIEIISRSVQEGLILLCADNYYYIKGTVFYVLSYYSQFFYIELSISVLFLWFQDTPV